jgi:hypothetical protein
MLSIVSGAVIGSVSVGCYNGYDASAFAVHGFIDVSRRQKCYCIYTHTYTNIYITGTGQVAKHHDEVFILLILCVYYV